MTQPLSVNRRVITVDDNPSIHEDYRRALCPPARDRAVDALEDAIFGGRDGGGPGACAVLEAFDVEHALQGEEALEKLRGALDRGEPYAVAFVDMRMPPGWDGVKTIEQLWKADPSVLVVICSAYSDYQWSEVLGRLPNRDQLLLLRKPFDPTEVWQLAESLCHKWTLSQRQVKSLEEANDRLAEELGRRRQMEEQLRHAALHDGLTALANRSLLLDRLAHGLERQARSPGRATAVLYLDLDNFKIVNDSLGHRAGDAILIEAARRITDAVRRTDTVGRHDASIAARLGGDEFVVLLEDVGDAGRAVAVAQRIGESLGRPFEVDGRQVILGASVGIAMNEPPGRTPDELLRNADTAMYQAKFSGKGRFALFDQHMHTSVLERMTLDADLRGAAERGELALAYQPIVALESGVIAGFEALLRWRHPVRGSIPPDVFIPIAEESSLIEALGLWALGQAVEALKDWRRLPAAKDVYVSVNLSRRQLADPGLPARLGSVIEGSGLAHEDFAFEITESGIMSGPEKALAILTELRARGSRVMMDDFGTGHSSLSCLHKFPIDVLKIDRSFVQTQEHNRGYAAVVRAIVALAHSLNSVVVAEGVETLEHLAQLQALECDLAQGYYFSRPVPAAEVRAMLEGARPFRMAA